jgi:hypothetical protein
VIRKVFESWEAQGGDPNRGRVLPKMLTECGFKVTQLNSISRVALTGEPLWKWPDSFFKSFLPRLVEQGWLTAEEQTDFMAMWNKAMKEEGRFFLGPTMLDIVAEKI